MGTPTVARRRQGRVQIHAPRLQISSRSRLRPGQRSFSSGTYRGRERVGEWFRTFAGGFHFDILEIREGGDRVALWARHTARGGHSGVEVVADFFYEYRVNDGKIVSLRFCETWAEALQIVAPRR